MTDDLFDIEQAVDDASASASVILRVHVEPGSGRPAVAGRRHDALSVRVAPSPAEDRANDACVGLVADLFGVTTGAVAVVSGDASRDKRLRVAGVDPERARRVLEQAIREAGLLGRPARRTRR